MGRKRFSRAARRDIFYNEESPAVKMEEESMQILEDIQFVQDECSDEEESDYSDSGENYIEYIQPESLGQSSESLSPGRFQVEKIVGRRMFRQDGIVQYLVQWKGYPPSESTWEPEDFVDNCPQLLEEFYATKREQPEPINDQQMIPEDESYLVSLPPDAIVVNIEDTKSQGVRLYHVTTEDDPSGIYLTWDEVKNHPSAMQKYLELMDRCKREEI